MDAIKRFTAINSIISGSQETETSPEQVPSQIPNAGIASTPDAFEMIQPIAFDLINLTTPITGESGNPNSPAPQETIEASSFFDLVGADTGKLASNSTDEIQEELDGQGIVDWDAIAGLKAQMAKSNPDEVAMVDTLLKLTPDDLAATLSQLASRGTPSDLKLMLHQIFTNDEAVAKLAPMLFSLVTDKHLPASQTKLLDKIFPMMATEKSAPTVVCDLIRMTRGQGILPKLSIESTTTMYQILHSHPNLQNTLFENALYQETQRPSMDGLRDPDKMPLDASTPEAMRDFPEWGINTLTELNRSGKLDIAVKNLRGRETDFLAQFCRCGNKAENILTEYLKSYQGERLTSFTSADLIRSIVQKLGETAVQDLSKFSPALLTDMKGILLAGNAEDLAVLGKVIEPALEASRKREVWTNGIQDSAQGIGDSIKF